MTVECCALLAIAARGCRLVLDAVRRAEVEREGLCASSKRREVTHWPPTARGGWNEALVLKLDRFTGTGSSAARPIQREVHRSFIVLAK